jgi:hypothetical protein
MMVFYWLVGGTPTSADLIEESLAPPARKWLVRERADKFTGSDLEQRKHKGIKSVRGTGSCAQGAVVGTSNDGPCSGATRVVPVDAMSAEDG